MLHKTTFQSAGKISQHIIPGAYSRIDSVRGAAGFVSGNNLVIMGQGYGLKPNTLYQFNSSPEAMSAIYGGPLREAVRLSFNPSPDFSPQRIFAMVVNAATQASYTLVDGSSNDMILLKSRAYGLHTNQIRVKVEAGTNSGKKITLEFKGSQELYDDVEQEMFTIQYGAGACTLTITNDSGTKTLVSSVGGLNITLTDYKTIGELVAYIDAQTDFTATVAPGAVSLSPEKLDEVSALDINTAAQTLHGDMYAIIDALNLLSNLVEASDVSAANGVNIPANVAAFVYFTGGTNGAYTSTEWTAALQALEAEDVQLIATPDSDASAHSSIKTHCETMSNVSNRKERQFLVGGAWAETEASAKTNARTLNSFTGLYVYNGFTQRNEFGEVANFGASYAACMLGAIKSAAALNEPLTSKQLNVISLEHKLRESQVESLLENGVCVLNYNDGGQPIVVRQFNTYQTNDLKYNEFSMVTEMFFASRDLRSYVQGLRIGKPGTRTVLGAVEGIVRSRLQTYVTDLGIFTEDAQGRTFWNVLVRVEADKVFVDYDANITAPTNFIFITQHFSEAA